MTNCEPSPPSAIGYRLGEVLRPGLGSGIVKGCKVDVKPLTKPSPSEDMRARNNLVPSGVAITFRTAPRAGLSGPADSSKVLAARTLSASFPATYTLFASGETSIAVGY